MRINGLLRVCTLAAAFTLLSGSFASAAMRCGHGPPAWWNAPRVTYTYSGGYADARHSHSFSAQRRDSQTAAPARYRDPYRRW